jgi:serine/threonine protein kinase
MRRRAQTKRRASHPGRPPPAAAQVESEIRILQQLRHEGLVSYAFIADEGSRISIVMPWAGTPLREHRAAAGAAYDSEDAARHIAHQLASALAYLHERGILHRDVKPDNCGVLEGERLRLFDWGEAVTLSEVAALGDKELSRRVGVAGTPLFMPPESLNHLTRRKGAGGAGDLRSTLTPALDVWGLGTVVYYVLAGRDIFVGDSDWELEELADVVNASDGVQLPECTRASYAARDFLARCLERCPARRATARELLGHPWLRGAASCSELEAALAADAAAAARRPGSVSSAGSGARRRAAGAGGARRGRGPRFSSSSSPAVVGPRARTPNGGAPPPPAGAATPAAAGAAPRAPRTSGSSSRPGSGHGGGASLSTSSNFSSSSGAAAGGGSGGGDAPKPVAAPGGGASLI